MVLLFWMRKTQTQHRALTTERRCRRYSAESLWHLNGLEAGTSEMKICQCFTPSSSEQRAHSPLTEPCFRGGNALFQFGVSWIIHKSKVRSEASTTLPFTAVMKFWVTDLFFFSRRSNGWRKMPIKTVNINRCAVVELVDKLFPN